MRSTHHTSSSLSSVTKWKDSCYIETILYNSSLFCPTQRPCFYSNMGRVCSLSSMRPGLHWYSNATVCLVVPLYFVLARLRAGRQNKLKGQLLSLLYTRGWDIMQLSLLWLPTVLWPALQSHIMSSVVRQNLRNGKAFLRSPYLEYPSYHFRSLPRWCGCVAAGPEWRCDLTILL